MTQKLVHYLKKFFYTILGLNLLTSWPRYDCINEALLILGIDDKNV